MKLKVEFTKVPVITLPAKGDGVANVEASRHPVYDATLALGTKNSVDAIISLFSDSSTNPFLPTWINFAQKNLRAAEKCCYDMRKQGASSAVASYFLSKVLYNLSAGQRIKVFAWCAVSAVKALKEEAFRTKVSYKDIITSILKELDGLAIEVKTDVDRILVEQINHYKIIYLASEEHLSAAFEEQRAKYLEDPNDIDNLRKLGWTLHDCINQSVEALANRKLVDFFSKELSRLRYPEEMGQLDPKLVKCYGSDLLKAREFLDGTGEVRALERSNDLSSALVAADKLVKDQPNNVEAHLAAARVYEKLARHGDALKEYLVADELSPNDARTQTGAAWALVRCVGSLLKDAKWSPKIENLILRGFDLFDRLKELQKPSLVYSQLMRVFAKGIKLAGKDVPWLVASKYVSFVKTWGTENFSQDDFKPFVPKDKPDQVYPSLVENVTSVLYRCAVATSRDGRALVNDNPWVVEFVGNAVDRFPAQQWYPYYYGKLLVELGRHEEARKYIIKTAQRKFGEFWVWQMLAETYPNDMDKQLMCLCRAVQCHVKDAVYLITVRSMLGKVFHAKGMDAEALLEFGIVDSLRADKGWRVVSHGEDFAAWSNNVVPAKDNMAQYKKWGVLADEIVLESLPSENAIVTARFLDREKNEEVAKLWWHDASGRRHEVRVRIWKFRQLGKMKPGSPVRVWTDLINGREVVLKVEARADGSAWDVYPKTVGMLIARDERRGVSVFVVGDKGETCVGDWAKIPFVKSIPTGSLCELVLAPSKNGYNVMLDCCVVENAERPGFVRDYSGEIRIPDGKRFGFVGIDVFVPDSLIVANDGVVSGTKVHGLAARSYDRTKNRVSWKAATLEVNS